MTEPPAGSQYSYGMGPMGPPPQAAPWPPEQRSAPREVEFAFRLWIANIVVGVIGGIANFTFGDPFEAGREQAARNYRRTGTGFSPAQYDSFMHVLLVFTAVFTLAFVVLEIFLLLKMRSGRNWARITLAVITGIAVLGVVLTAVITLVGGTTSALTIVVGLVGMTLIGAATILMFRPAANAYFSGRPY